jgi:hypothetical protein
MWLASASRVRAGVFGAVIAGALALVAYATAAGTREANFPSKGIVVPGVSIGGIQIGMTEQQVLARWGHIYEVCDTCGPNLTWLFEYQGSEPLGAAVRFDVKGPWDGHKTGTPQASFTKTQFPTTGKVIAVFTLGSPLGWGTKGKVMMFDPVSNVYNVLGNPQTVACIGYTALVVRAGQNSMAIYTASGVVYGFALTAPKEPTCQ